MDNLELDIDFIVNNPEAKKNLEAVKKDVLDVGVTAEQTAEKVKVKVAEVATETEKSTKKVAEVGEAGKDAFGEMIDNASKAKGPLGDIGEAYRSLNSLLTGLGFASIAAFAVGLIVKWYTTLTTAEQVAESFEKTMQDVATSQAKAAAETDIYTEKISDSIVPIAKRQELLDEFILKSPQILGGLNLQNIATAEGEAILKDYNEALFKKIELQQLEKSYTESLQRKADLKSGKLDDEVGLDGFQKGIITFLNIVAFQGKDGTKKQIEADNKVRRDAAIKTEEANAENYKKQIKSVFEGTEKLKNAEDTSLKALEKSYATNGERLRNLQKGESDEALKADRENLKTQIEARKKELGLDTKKEEIKKPAVVKTADTALANALGRQKNLLDKLADLRNEYDGKTYTKDEAELNALKQKFAKARRIIQDFNEDPKNKRVEKINVADLNAIEKKATDQVLAKQAEVKAEKERIQRDKNFQEALKASETYEIKKQAIEEKYAKLKGDLLTLPADEYVKRATQLDANEKDELNRAMDEKVKKEAIFEEFYKGVEDLSDKNAKKLIADAKAVLDALVKAGKITPQLAKKIGGDLNATSKAIDDRLPKKLSELASSLGSVAGQVGKIDSGFGEMLGTLANVVGSVGNIKSSISALKEAQGSGDLLGGLTAGLGIAGAGIGIITSVFSAINKGKEEQKKAEKEQIEYSNSLQLKAIEAQTKAMERQLALIKDLYGTERIAKYGESLISLNQKIKGSADAAQGKGLITGNKFDDDIINKLNSGETAKNILKGFNPAKDVDKYKRAIDAIDKYYNGGLAKLNIDLSKGADEIERLQQLLESGKLDETTAVNVQNLITYAKQYQETLNAFKAETTGSTFQELGDEIVDMFSRGETSAEDFGKSFQNIMRKYLLNTFKGQVMDKALQDYYNKFDAYAKDGIDATEKADLQSLYAQILEDNKKKFEQLQEVTGIDLTNTDATASSNTIRGNVANITANQADVLSGNIGGMRLAVIESSGIQREGFGKIALSGSEQLAMLKTQHLTQMEIAANTLRTANNTDRLKAIEEGITKMANNNGIRAVGGP